MVECAQRGMAVPTWGQAYWVMASRAELGGPVVGISAGQPYWTASGAVNGWTYPVYIMSNFAGNSDLADANILKVRCVKSL